MTNDASIPDLYAALGVAPAVSSEGLAAAYRKAARRAHPDGGGSHEQFIEINFAWRLLSDARDRRRFDSLWKLQTAIEFDDDTTALAAHRLLDDADAALSGWRLPSELTPGVDGLSARSGAWVRDVERKATQRAESRVPPRNNRDQARDESRRREGEQSARETSARYAKSSAEAAQQMMIEWPSLLASMQSDRPFKARNLAVKQGYRTYTMLRNLQDALDLRRRLDELTDDEAQLFLHASRAVLMVRSDLLRAQASVGKSYSFKNENWLTDCRRRARRVLEVRDLRVGDPPWSADHHQESAHEGQDQESGTTPGGRVNAEGSNEPSSVDDQPNSSAESGESESSERSSDSSPTKQEAASPADGRIAHAVGLAAVVVAVGVLAWAARNRFADALPTVAGIAVVIGLVWLLTTNAEFRTGLGKLFVGYLKLVWSVLRGVAVVTGKIFTAFLDRK